MAINVLGRTSGDNTAEASIAGAVTPTAGACGDSLILPPFSPLSWQFVTGSLP